ncbi:MAG: UDP-N-acetylmuramoyl-tripeptide--D-alanyl-D-alanine ligase [Bacteroidales bacterium]|nr:UDP-N-acetylmuramoyl-tripeptide--D-alanyl-D-alanine ligase [Bacteroidales bacterium]
MKIIEKIYQLYSEKYIVTTDSRKVEPGCVFVALKGEHFDGNDFAYQVANDNIAACVIADRKDLPHHERLFIVDDSLTTLQELAKLHREKCNTPIIGITGTNGKTTTKELVASVLSQKYNIIYTQGNFNNHLGVPLTLFQIKPDTEIAVVEMGANHPKEIELLCSLAQPNFGIITNIGKAHIEGFGSFEGVVKTKNELYDYLRNTNGKVFLNNDNHLLKELAQNLTNVKYGKDDNADYHASILSSNPYLSISWNNNTINTKLVGEYNFENVMAAITVGCYFNVDQKLIIKALESYHPTNNRSQFIKTEKNEVVMDAYNANPVSMSNSVKNFRNISDANHLLILGDMKELGNESLNEHQEIINLIKELKFNNVILVGSEFNKINHDFVSFLNVDELIRHINQNEISGMKILVKGSNSIHLEKIINLL